MPMSPEELYAETREAFLHYIERRLEVVAQRHNLNTMDEGVFTALRESYRQALEDMGSPLAGYFEGWK